MKNYTFLLLICLACVLNSRAQSVMFNQYQANVIYENPAFVGAFERPTFSAYYGQHISFFEDIGNNYYKANSSPQNIGDNYGFSYQQYSDLVKGGIGISFTGVHYYSDGNYSVINDGLKLSYSPTIKIFKKIYLKPGIDVGVYYEKEKYPSLAETWTQNPDWENTINSLVVGEDNHSNAYLDVNGGLLLYGENFHIAICVNHLNNPSTYSLNNYINPDVYNLTNNINSVNTKLPVHNLITVNMGMNINSKDSAKTWTLSPHFFVQTNGYYQMNYPSSSYDNRYNSSVNGLIGLTFRYKRILIGLDYGIYDDFNPNDALVPMIGYQNKMFRISYSYTINLKDNYYPYSSSPCLNSILLTYSLPAKSKSTPPLFTTIY